MLSATPQYGTMLRPQRLILLGVVCLAIRAMIPVGYMPGNLLAGEFMVLCPVGMPAGIAQRLHVDHGDHDGNVVDADRSCPIGSALQPAWLPTDIVQATLSRTPSDHSARYRYESVTANRVRQYQSRAPPRA